MADLKKKVPGNVDGDLFVDTSCGNFGICRELAPTLFKRLDDYHIVSKQPESDAEKREALRAIICCPNGSIGTQDRQMLKEVFADFPICVEDEVYYCGFNSPKSAGANSYFIKHKDGNWLVSTPKYVPHLVSSFDAMGGISYIFLSHRDDLAESAKYSDRFGARTIVHELDSDCRPSAEHIIRGFDEVDFAPEFKIIPTPGHTEGHCMLLYRNYFLFTGDSLRYDVEHDKIETWNPYWTWYSYEEQAKSTAGLINYKFNWILASHGFRVKRDLERMRAEIELAAEAAANIEGDPCDEMRIRNLNYYAAELRQLQQADYAEKMEQKAVRLRERLDKRV